MADYISTLLDDNETDTISPTTTIPAIRDANNNYLDNTLMAADLNAAKNGKIAALDSGKVNTSDIYNALDQTNAGKVLDARQGKVLNDAINAISNPVLYSANDIFEFTGDAPTLYQTYGYKIGRLCWLNFDFTYTTSGKLNGKVSLKTAFLPVSTFEAVMFTDSGLDVAVVQGSGAINTYVNAKNFILSCCYVSKY